MHGLPLQCDDLMQSIGAAYQQACLHELEALKPGNVHRFADGHGMTLQDFVTSANVSVSPLTAPGLSLGERIFRAVEATREAVGCNTNLGILLLCAPLVQSLLDDQQPPGKLRDRVRHLLMRADVNDTVWLFRAIQLASPGGLGESDQHDVSQPSTAPLFEVMAHAAERDLIARQYATGFADLFDFALPRLQALRARWQNPAWATTGLYLALLARFPDTHIQRKHGRRKAAAVSRQAADLAREFSRVEKPEHYQLRLLHADTEFKREGINPGTSADMTVATLFLSYLETMLPAFEQKTGFSRVRDSRSDGMGIRS